MGYWWRADYQIAGFDERLEERNEAYAYECSLWLRGFENEQPYSADFSDIHFQPKPSRDIRREKTRDYRKRRPRTQKYQPDYSLAAGLLFTFLGA